MKRVFDILTITLLIVLVVVCICLGYQAGFNDGVTAAWECHTDMECELLEDKVGRLW